MQVEWERYEKMNENMKLGDIYVVCAFLVIYIKLGRYLR